MKATSFKQIKTLRLHQLYRLYHKELLARQGAKLCCSCLCRLGLHARF